MKHLYSKFWWIFFGRGLFGIAIGVLGFIWLVQVTRVDMDSFGLTALLKQAVVAQIVLVLLGAYALMDGIFALVLGFQNYGEGRHWWGLVVEGLVGIALFFWLFLRPDQSIWALYDWVVFWAIFSGSFEVVQAFDPNEYVDRRRAYLGFGLVSIAFGLALVHFVDQINVLMIGLLGGYAMFFGTLFLRLGWRFRSFWEGWKKVRAGKVVFR